MDAPFPWKALGWYLSTYIVLVDDLLGFFEITRTKPIRTANCFSDLNDSTGVWTFPALPLLVDFFSWPKTKDLRIKTWPRCRVGHLSRLPLQVPPWILRRQKRNMILNGFVMLVNFGRVKTTCTLELSSKRKLRENAGCFGGEGKPWLGGPTCFSYQSLKGVNSSRHVSFQGCTSQVHNVFQEYFSQKEFQDTRKLEESLQTPASRKSRKQHIHIYRKETSRNNQNQSMHLINILIC